MIIAYIPILFALLGLLMYVLASSPKLAEIGRLTFAVALWLSLWPFVTHALRLP